jgi:hypothetical protein
MNSRRYICDFKENFDCVNIDTEAKNLWKSSYQMYLTGRYKRVLTFIRSCGRQIAALFKKKHASLI